MLMRTISTLFILLTLLGLIIALMFNSNQFWILFNQAVSSNKRVASIHELIITPKRFLGTEVYVPGVLARTSSVSELPFVLYATQDDFKMFNVKAGIGLKFNDLNDLEARELYAQCDGHYFMVLGKFDQDPEVKLGYVEITSIEEIGTLELDCRITEKVH